MLKDSGLSVRQIMPLATDRERRGNVQSYIVEHTEGVAPADECSAWVEWQGAGVAQPRLLCRACQQVSFAEPDCAHIEAVRLHLGYR